MVEQVQHVVSAGQHDIHVLVVLLASLCQLTRLVEEAGKGVELVIFRKDAAVGPPQKHFQTCSKCELGTDCQLKVLCYWLTARS